MVRHKEAIHSGHFMVSNFEAEAQDDEEDIAVPVSENDFESKTSFFVSKFFWMGSAPIKFAHFILISSRFPRRRRA